MKFALHFGNNTFSDPEGARRLVRLAKAAGFDSGFAVEHVVFPDSYEPGGRLPGGPSAKLPEPLLTWVGAATTRLRFMTAVMILPQRNATRWCWPRRSPRSTISAASSTTSS
jgi:alkanesulfonate monooxygenase SsuD/methylene tetrahydromethanopterin reductase-like flavin-dependent oxidoreductase (luciferase family)